jgi:hypothetical protein
MATPRPDALLRKVVTPAGFEPATIRLEGECSIQLSYGASCTGQNRSAPM